MAEAIWSALVGVGGSALIVVLGAFFSGKVKLVSGSHVRRLELEAEKWQTAFNETQKTNQAQAEVLQRQQMTNEIVNIVLNTLKSGGTQVENNNYPAKANIVKEVP